MASQSVATGLDSEGKGDADASDGDEKVMIAWLKEKRLDAFIESFKQTKTTMEDLRTLEDTDITLSPLTTRPTAVNHGVRVNEQRAPR